MVKKDLEIPDGYNYVAAFLTLKCGLGCSYCINEGSGQIKRNRKEKGGDEWISGLNRLKLKRNLSITLEGGEPTSHKEFYDIVEKVEHPLDLLTNLQFDVDEFINRVDPNKFSNKKNPAYKSIRASFHGEKMHIDETIERTVKLQDHEFRVGLFSLNLPENLEDNMRMAEKARKEGIYFFIKDFLGYRDGRLFGHFKYPIGLEGIAKKSMCKTTELLIAPDLETYRCHRDLYLMENPLGKLNETDFFIRDIFRECNQYGKCNPCDLKLKTNRFLQAGSCSVEIIQKNP